MRLVPLYRVRPLRAVAVFHEIDKPPLPTLFALHKHLRRQQWVEFERLAGSAAPDAPKALPEPAREAATAAPVPNRDLEAPHVSTEERAHLGPSILYQNMPNPRQAAGGSLNQSEDKLYKPAPGARLNVPFSY